MSKYAPLSEALSRTTRDKKRITFAEIERILGAPLPPTARRDNAWWANNATGHSQAKGWLGAGFRTSEVNLEGETVTFVRDKHEQPLRHPLIGCMKGTVIVAEGVDLTEPALPPEEWTELEKKYDNWP